MKIGIGVTTYNRPKHIELWEKQLKLNFNIETCTIHIANDSNERMGIAFRKNECLKNLSDNDYIFLFDDDCFPIKEGWAEFFIEASKATRQHHFMYLKETPTIKKIMHKTYDPYYYQYSVQEHINIYNNCAGCMMFLTKEVIQKVGGYNPAYGIYGYEHAGYSNRIHQAGLTPIGAYTCPALTGEYIYSMDYDFHLPFNKQVNHEPSLKNEFHLLENYLKQNKQIYDADFQIYQPL